MKKDIHPKYFPTKVFHNGELVFTTGGTTPELHVEVWSGSHPFFTGSDHHPPPLRSSRRSSAATTSPARRRKLPQRLPPPVEIRGNPNILQTDGLRPSVCCVLTRSLPTRYSSTHPDEWILA